MAQQSLTFKKPRLFDAVSPALEMGAYEELWRQSGMTQKKIAELFRDHPAAMPSDLVDVGKAAELASQILGQLRNTRFGVCVNHTSEYPTKLRDAKDPVELLYYRGRWSLVESRAVAVVGTRKPSADGLSRARSIARALVKHGRTVVSGLAAGIDTAAHKAAIEAGGQTIAVIGTPINQVYPPENAALQEKIASEFLLVSQVPICRYSQQNPTTNKFFFPERNVTMSALSDATVIVEAGETSGTLIQARHAIQQGRKLFILDSCFRQGLSWPKKYLDKGAMRVSGYEEIEASLPAVSSSSSP